VIRKVRCNDREDDDGEEDEKQEKSCRSKKDDEEVCRKEVCEDDRGEARSRHEGACKQGQGRQISGTQADRQNGDDRGAAQETGCRRRARHEAASGPAKAGHAGRRGAEAVRAGAGCSARRPDSAAAEP